jgi:hypothetical protein
MAVGSLGPCPFKCGGGLTEQAKAYGIIKRAVGKGGSAPNEEGIDGLWRRSRAHGLAAATSSYRRAILQAFPNLATDLLPYYERVLGVVLSADATEADYQEAVTVAWVTWITAVLPALAERLKAIDSRLEILSVDHDYATTTVLGRAFAPLHSSLGEAPFGGVGYSITPNYSTDFFLRVEFAVGYTTPLLASDARILEQVKELLLDVLPSWVDFEIVTSLGFLVGTSPLGRTGLIAEE